MSGTGKIVKGRTWTNESCTPAKLNAFIDSAELQNLDQTDLATNYGTIITSATQPSDTDALWRDSATSNIIKYYTGSAWAAVGSTTLMNSISTDGNSEDMADGFEDAISGCCVSTTNSGAEIRVSKGSAMINKKLRRTTSAIDTNPGTDPDAGDWLDVWILADAAATTFTVSLVDSGTTPGGSSNPGTNGRLIGSVYHIGSGEYGKWLNFRPNRVTGWDYFTGTGTSGGTKTLTFGVTFENLPTVTFGLMGAKTSVGEPNNPNELTENPPSAMLVLGRSWSNTSCTLGFESSGTFTSGDFYAFGFNLEGSWS